ncbi:MAG TPA: hypothetical protein VE990_15990 [Acidimicrobiales bacterium]|nr:hypothetical protein [Acidimicrobiales bacterium]
MASTSAVHPAGLLRSWAALGAVVLTGGLSVWAVGYYAVQAVSFEPTDGARWRQWEAAPVATAGLAGLGLTAAALMEWLLLRRRHPRLGVALAAAALASTVVALVVAARVDSGRHRPVAGERAIVAGLALPASWGASRYTVVPETPPQIEPGPPRVARALTSATAPLEVCDQLNVAVRRWGASVLSSSFTAAEARPSAPVCYLVGSTAQGWSYDAEVRNDPASGATTITVQVGPPG